MVVCILAVLLIAGLTLCEYVFHRDLGVDTLIFQQRTIDSDSPVRPAPISAATLVLVGSALLMTIFEFGVPVAQLLALTGSFLGVLAVTGYVFQIKTLYAIGTSTAISVEMAVMAAVLGLAVLFARPELGLAGILSSSNVGGVVARRLMPFGIGFPFLLVLLAYVLQLVRLGRTPLSGIIFLFLGIVLFTAPILWTAGLLYRTDKKRERAERHLAAQYAVATLISGSNRVHEVAQPILDEICMTIGWDSGAIWEFASTGNLTRIASFNNAASDDRGTPLTTVSLEEPVWQSGAAIFPIRVQGTTVGLVECRNEKKPPRDEEVIQVMEAIAAQIGQFVERKRSDREIRRVNRDLRDREDQLHAANKELEAFSYSVSHDLRAPIRHISGFVQLLARRSGNALDDQGRRYLHIISNSCAKMGELVDDLLSFSRMGRADMLRGRVDLNGIVRQIIDELAPAASGRTVQWTIGTLPEVIGDSAMLRIVLTNYISNAIKYTQKQDNPAIEIGSSTDANSEFVIFVKDNGAGFDMKYAAKLFGVFQRLHRDDEFEGTGIGLATARRIISRHGGRTWAEAALEQGATFYFSLPQSQEQLSNADIKTDSVGRR